MALSVEEQDYITNLEKEIDRMSSPVQSYSNPGAAMFGGPQKQNLVEWQLDFRPELEDIEHLLRNDVLVIDSRGEHWARNPNKDFVLFNDHGVNDIIREIRMFLNKNTVLSNYKEDKLALRIKLLGHELRVLIYNNYELYGMDNDYKQNNYSIIVLTVVAMVESAYRRSINGEERRDLNSARMVNQTDNPNPSYNNPYNMPMQQKSKGGISKILPWNWGR